MKTGKALLINYPIGQIKLKKNLNLLWALSRQQKRYCLLTPRAICKYVTAGSNCVLSGARNVRNIVMGTVEVEHVIGSIYSHVRPRRRGLNIPYGQESAKISSPCLHVNMSTCQHVNKSTCQHVNMSTCQHVVMSLCHHVVMSSCHHHVINIQYFVFHTSDKLNNNLRTYRYVPQTNIQTLSNPAGAVLIMGGSVNEHKYYLGFSILLVLARCRLPIYMHNLLE